LPFPVFSFPFIMNSTYPEFSCDPFMSGGIFEFQAQDAFPSTIEADLEFTIQEYDFPPSNDLVFLSPSIDITRDDALSSHSDGGSSHTEGSDYGRFQEVPVVNSGDRDAVSNPYESHDLAPKKRKKESLASLTEEQRIDRRRKKNRVAAAESRARKQQRLSVLEVEVAGQKSLNNTLLQSNESLRSENEKLKLDVERLRLALYKKSVVPKRDRFAPF